MAIKRYSRKKQYEDIWNSAGTQKSSIGSGKSNLEEITKATNNASSIPVKSTATNPNNVASVVSTPSDPFDAYKASTYQRLWVADDNEFQSVTGLNFTDTYQQEFYNSNWIDQKVQELDKLIGSQYRTQRDTWLAVNNLNSQLEGQKADLTGIDNYLWFDKDIQNAINSGITDINQIAQSTGLDTEIVQAIQSGDTTRFNERINLLKDQVNNYWDTASSITRNAEIAKKLGISEAMVEKISSGKANNLWVSDAVKSQLEKDTNKYLDRLEEDYEFNKSEANKRLEEYKADFARSIEDQKIRNEIIEGNMSRLAGISGAGFSSRWLGGIEEVTRQSIAIIEDMQTGYDRATGQVATYLQRLETDYVRANADAQENLERSINNVTAWYLANIESIKSKFWEVSDDAITRLNDASAIYLENIQNIEQQGIDNMFKINQEMRANLKTAQEQQIFQNEESTRIAQQMINTGVSMNDVTAMVASGDLTPQMAREIHSQMTQNVFATLDSVGWIDGLWATFGDDVKAMMSQWLDVYEILSKISSSPEFRKAVQEANIAKDPFYNIKLQNQQLQNKLLQSNINQIDFDLQKDQQEFLAENVGWLQWQELAKTLASGQYGDKKFFGLYATADPTGETFANTYYAQAEQMWLDSYMQKRQERGSAITADMVENAANKYNIDPLMIAAKMAQDSSMGTKGKGARNNNPWNVGQLDRLDAQGITVEWYATLQEGVDAVAENFAKRQNALASTFWLGDFWISDSVMESARNIVDGIGDYPSKNDPEYRDVQSAVSKVVEEKKATTDDPQLKMIYDSAKYSKDITDTTSKQITDAFTVLWGVDNLMTQLENMEDDIWPIEWYLRGKNPYDVNAQAITAQLNSLVPKVARWVFWEVGVLTDQDIERYMRTLPNNKMPKDLTNIIGDLLRITVTKSVANTIVTQAKARKNTTGFAWDYENAKAYLESKWVSANPRDSYTGGSAIKWYNFNEIDSAVWAWYTTDEIESDW